MFIKYTYIGDRSLIHIPDSCVWEIRFRFVEPDMEEGKNLYLVVGDKEFCLRDSDFLCNSKTDLSHSEVENLYMEIIDAIAGKIAETPTLKVVDIDAIEAHLLAEKFQGFQTVKERCIIGEDGDGELPF